MNNDGTINNEVLYESDINGEVINEHFGIINQCGTWNGGIPSPITYTTGNCSGSKVDELEAFSVLIYPNPASNNLTIDLGDLTGVNTAIKLYDSYSKLVFEKHSSSTLLIDVSRYSKGLYNLEIFTSDKVLRSKLVIE